MKSNKSKKEPNEQCVAQAPSEADVVNYLKETKALERKWATKVDPFGMVMTLTATVPRPPNPNDPEDKDKEPDSFIGLVELMKMAQINEVGLDPEGTVLSTDGRFVTVTIRSIYGDASTFKAAIHRWNMTASPMAIIESTKSLKDRAEAILKLADSMKSVARRKLEGALATRSGLETQLSAIQSKIGEANGTLSEAVVELIKEEKLLQAVTWVKSSENGVNIFKHSYCPELNSLTGLMGIVDPGNPTLTLDRKTKIVNFVSMSRPADPPMVLIINSGSFLDAAEFVKAWGLTLEDKKEKEKK